MASIIRMKRILQKTGFAVSLAAAVMSGLCTAFNVYAMAIKETFQYTQSEVEFIASSSVAGMGLSFLQPMLTSRYGYQVTYVIALILTPMACLLVYVGTLFVEFFSHWPILIGLFLFIANASNSMFLVQIFEIGVVNNDKIYSGKIIGAYSGLVGLGKIFFCGLYEIFFNGNLGGFFFTLAILWAVNVLLCMLLHRPASQEDEPRPSLTQSDTSTELDSHETIPGTDHHDEKHTERKDRAVDLSKETELELDENRIGVKVVLKSCYFHLMFWSSVVFYSVFFAFLNNLTTIGDSAGVKNPLVPVYFMSLTMVFSRVLSGIIYDLFQCDRNGFIILYVTYLCFSVAMVVGLTCFNLTGVYVMMFLVGVSAGGGNTVPWAMLSINFGSYYLSPIMGGFFGSVTFVVLAMQAFIGFSYDLEISSEDSASRYCQGAHCFHNSFLVLLLVVIFISVVQIVNLCMLKRKGKQSWILGQPS